MAKQNFCTRKFCDVLITIDGGSFTPTIGKRGGGGERRTALLTKFWLRAKPALSAFALKSAAVRAGGVTPAALAVVPGRASGDKIC